MQAGTASSSSRPGSDCSSSRSSRRSTRSARTTCFPVTCVALPLWLATYYAWHVPAAYDYVLTRPLVHDLEHATFVLAGVLVWAQIVDPARRGALSRYRRLAFAVALFAGGQVLADVLIFSFNPFYAAYADQPERLFGLSPRLDQQLAGVVMMVEQILTVGTASVFLLRPAFQRRRSVERRLTAPSV